MGFSGKKQRRLRPDRLSSLPDEILHLILSYIEALDVVKTCVLSKRWKNVWKSVPCLKFDVDSFFEQKHESASQDFWLFIMCFLVLRDNSQIGRIRLCALSRTMSFLHQILLVASLKNVLQLDIEDHIEDCAEELQFPPGLCEKLTSLYLDFPYGILMRPEAVFKNLKDLDLRGITITNDLIENIFSTHCVGLEEVYLEECKVIGVEQVCIAARNLKKLTFMNVFDEDLSDNPFDYVLNILAPNMEFFEYIGPMLRGFSFLKPIDVVIICIVCSPKGYIPPSPARFTGLTHVKTLTLSSSIVKHFSRTDGNPLEDDFILENLTCLKMSLRYTVRCIKGMINLLGRSPNLENLVIVFREVKKNLPSGSNSNNTSTGGSWTSSAENMFCPLHNLKTVSFSHYDGTELALWVVKLLLENGKLLEEIYIMHGSKGNSKYHTDIAQVKALPRASVNLVLSFPEDSKVLSHWFDVEDSDTEDD